MTVASPLAPLAAIFAELSLLAFGGLAPILPELQRQVVAVHGYMDAVEFAALFALAQAAPGPNMLVATLIGWRVAGLPGALVATGALIGPSSLLTYAVSSTWHRLRDRPWRRLVQAGLTPVTVGLVAAGAALIARSTSTGAVPVAITMAAATLLVATRVHPLAVLAAGTVVGVVFG